VTDRAIVRRQRRRIFLRRSLAHVSRFTGPYAGVDVARGKIVCHIIDADGEQDFSDQLAFLAERDVQTFVIHSRRGAVVRDLARSVAPPAATVHVVAPSGEPFSLWRSIDAINARATRDQWCLILKAGDILAYPFFETRTIPDLCQFLFNEHRDTFFALQLEAYHPSLDAKPLRDGAPGWRIDSHGYDFTFDDGLNADLWRGGLSSRTEGHDDHISRIPLYRLTGKIFPRADIKLVIPSRFNLACAAQHLSPTGCVLSDRAFRRWAKGMRAAPSDDVARRREKLLSAPHIEVKWR